MAKFLAVSAVLLAWASGPLALAGEFPSLLGRSTPDVDASAAESPPRSLSSTRHIQPLPAAVPGLKLTVEQNPVLRQEYLPLGRFWSGRLRVGCFRRFYRAPALDVPLASKIGLVPRPEPRYGIEISIHLGEAELEEGINEWRCGRVLGAALGGCPP